MARKLVLPLIAVGMMTTMMYLESLNSAHASSSSPPAAARMSPGVHQR